jgi:hypothetical protein
MRAELARRLGSRRPGTVRVRLSLLATASVAIVLLVSSIALVRVQGARSGP